MAEFNVEKIEIKVNKELAAQAYRAGYIFGLENPYGVIIKDEFEDWWSELMLRWRESGEPVCPRCGADNWVVNKHKEYACQTCNYEWTQS